MTAPASAPRTRSLGARLTTLLAGVAALLSLLSWGTVTQLAERAAARSQDDVLAAAATAFAETLRAEEGEIRIELPYAAFAMLGAIGEDRVFYRVSTGDGVLTGYPDLPVAAPGAPPGRVSFDTRPFLGEAVRVAQVTRSVSSGAGPQSVVVAVAQTRQGVEGIVAELSGLAAMLSLAFFFVAVALTALAARAALAPLTEIAGAVARRGPADLRPLNRAAPAELAPLVGALDRLMERLDSSIRRSEEFIAEAAHRIRTPLATVRAHAEVALHAAEAEETRDRLRRMVRAIDESSRSAGQILDHAAVAFRVEEMARSPVDLAALARAVADDLAHTAALREIVLRLDAGPAEVRGDPVLIESALRNVLDNAVKYSPADSSVAMRVRGAPGEGRVSVCDEGPGLGPAPADLVQRFRRGQNAAGIVGSGLGLTIADEVLRAHGGRLDIAARAGPGTCVTLVLPAA